MVKFETPDARGIAARDRLQDAQRREKAAVANVYKADAALERARARYDQVTEAAAAVVAEADAAVARARGELIDVSGRDRAAALLGIDRAELRKPGATRD